LKTESGWQKAIDIAEDRIRGRWLRWADRIADEQYAGFAVLALDCIVLESLWGFKEGKPVPKRSERQVYRDLLTGPNFGFTEKQSDAFREFVRNGLMHDAETRGRWRIEKTIPKGTIIERNTHGDYVINRSRFHHAVTAAVDDWIRTARNGDATLRENIKKRIEQIIATHYKK